MGEEVEGLEDHAQPPTHGHRVDGRIGDHLAVEEDVTVVDVLQQVDAAQQRRLARTRCADERDRLVLGDQQVDAAHGDEAPNLTERLGRPASVGRAVD
jgi:hypothetical protein